MFNAFKKLPELLGCYHDRESKPKSFAGLRVPASSDILMVLTENRIRENARSQLINPFWLNSTFFFVFSFLCQLSRLQRWPPHSCKTLPMAPTTTALKWLAWHCQPLERSERFPIHFLFGLIEAFSQAEDQLNKALVVERVFSVLSTLKLDHQCKWSDNISSLPFPLSFLSVFICVSTFLVAPDLFFLQSWPFPHFLGLVFSSPTADTRN